MSRFGCRGYQGVLFIKRGDIVAGSLLLHAGVDELLNAWFALRCSMFLGNLAAALGDADQVPEGFGEIEEALAWTEYTGGRWTIAELVRIKSELLLLQGAEADTAKAEDHLQQALDWARRQGALSWELRAAFARAAPVNSKRGGACA